MNAPIEDQLRDYFRMVDRMQDPVDVDSIVQPAGPPRLRLVDTENTEELENVMLAPNNNDRPTRSRVMLLAAAAAAAIALVGGLLVVGNRGDDVPSPADVPSVPENNPDTDGQGSIVEVGAEVLVPQFVMSSRFAQSGEVLSAPEVEMGADVLGCSSLSYVDSGGGVTTDRVYTCESGERVGSFTVRFRPQGYANADFLSGWAVVGATGDFVGLQGEGVMFIDVHDTRDEAGMTFVGQIDRGTDG